MTLNQERMLRLLALYGRAGYIELEINWGEYEPRSSREDDQTGWAATRLVVRSLVRSLIRRGFAMLDEYGVPDITPAGLAYLETIGQMPQRKRS